MTQGSLPLSPTVPSLPAVKSSGFFPDPGYQILVLWYTVASYSFWTELVRVTVVRQRAWNAPSNYFISYFPRTAQWREDRNEIRESIFRTVKYHCFLALGFGFSRVVRLGLKIFDRYREFSGRSSLSIYWRLLAWRTAFSVTAVFSTLHRPIFKQI